MKRPGIFCLICIVAFLSGFATAMGQLFPVKINGKWGLIDSTGKLLVPATSAWIPEVKGNFAVVESGGKMGLYEVGGDWELQPEYDFVQFENHNRVFFCKGGERIRSRHVGGLWGFMDYASGLHVPEQFAAMEPFEKGIARIYLDGFCDGDSCRNGKWIFIDSTGVKIYATGFDKIEFESNGYFKVGLGGNKGIVDSSGAVLIPAEYNDIIHVVNDLFIVKSFGKAGIYVAGKGMKISAIYEDIKPLSSSSVGFRENTLWGMMDTVGNKLMNAFYENVEGLSCGMVRLQLDNGRKVGMANAQGKIILPVEYSGIWNCGGRFFQFSKDNLKGIADTSGKIIHKAAFENIYNLSGNSWLCSLAGITFILDTLGNKLLTAPMDYVGTFSNGMAPFRNKNLWGAIHQNGNVVIPCRFNNVVMIEKMVVVQKELEWFSIQVDSTMDFAEAESFLRGEPYVVSSEQWQYRTAAGLSSGSGMAPRLSPTDVGWFNSGGWWGWRNSSRKMIIRPSYDGVEVFRGTDFSITRKEKLFGLVNHTNGKVLAPPFLKYVNTQEYAVTNCVRGITEDGKQLILINGKTGIVPLPKVAYVGQESEGYRRYNLEGQLKMGEGLKDPVENNFWPFYGNRFIDISVSRGKWAYLRNNKPLAHPVFFEQAGDFFKGHAIVKLNGKWGLIDTKMNFVLKNEYDRIEVLDSSANPVVYLLSKTGDRYGFTDSLGTIIIPCNYKSIHTLSEGIAGVHTPLGWQFIREDGSLLCQAVFAEAGDFHEGKARVRKLKSRYWGFVDTTGADVTPFKFARVGNFVNGLAPAQIGDWGFIDAAGNWVIQPKFSSASDFVNGVAVVGNNGKFGLINSEGKIILPLIYSAVGPVEGEFVKIKDKNKFGLATLSGIVVLKPKYTSVEFPEGGWIRFKEDYQTGFANLEGKVELKMRNPKITDFHEGIAAAMENGKWKFVDSAGRQIGENEFRSVGCFSNGWCPVMQKDMWTYLNRDMKKTFGYYNDARNFSEGLAAVKNAYGYWGYVNESGKEYIGFIFEEAGDFVNGRARVKCKGNYGWIDGEGRWLVEPTFEKAESVPGGNLKVKIRLAQGIANGNGEILLPVENDRIENRGKLIQVQCGSSVGYINKHGFWVWEKTK